MNKTFKKLAAAALAALSLTSVMATTASAYKLDYDTVAYDYITVNKTSANAGGFILNKSTLNDYPEISADLIKMNTCWGYSAMWTGFTRSHGKILGVLEASLTVEDAYALASKMIWYDVNGDRMYTEMRYNEEVSRFYLVCSQAYSDEIKFFNDNFRVDTNKQYIRDNGARTDVMIKSVGCYPDVNVNIKEHTMSIDCNLPQYLRVVKPEFTISDNGRITVRWMDDNTRTDIYKDVSFSGTITLNDYYLRTIKNVRCQGVKTKGYVVDKYNDRF